MGLLGDLLGAFFGVKDVMGLESSDIIQFQFEELKSIARPLFNAANKRIDRIKDADLTFTPALDSVEASGGRFYMAGFVDASMINALRAEVFRARSFILDKTSTLSAARKYDGHIKEMIAGDKAAEINRDLGSAIWRLYRMAEETNFAGVQAFGSDNIVALIYESIDEMSEDELLQYIQDNIAAEYERAEEEMERALAEDAGFVI